MRDEATNNNLEELEIELLLEAVFRHYGYDLRDYDRGVVRLRIRERMLAGRIPTVSRFQERVLRELALLERLLGAFSPRDLLMFSDPAFYRSFRTKVVPQLRTYPFVRIWHAGCSTGEDVYSMAILLKEEGLYERARIYATDMSKRAITRARAGSFSFPGPDECAANYRSSGGKWSLSQYFRKKGKRASIDPALKKNIVFSEHNLATDGSFNEFQVVVCRGVLGSFNHKLRERVDRLFYESLSRFGVLALGPADSIESMPYENCYARLDTESCLYQKRGMPSAAASNW